MKPIGLSEAKCIAGLGRKYRRSGWLKKASIDVATDISENTDLCCSCLLPGKIYVGDFEIEPGTYNLTIEFLDEEGEVINTTEIKGYKVLKNGLNLLEAFSLN